MIMPNGNIHLQVAPEVSTLDFTDAVTMSGFSIPALSTRNAETEFELQDGQSFVIAGLMDDRVTSLASKIPGLGDLPIIGNLFKSKNLQKSKTELMVLCTVRRISPSTQAPNLRCSRSRSWIRTSLMVRKRRTQLSRHWDIETLKVAPGWAV